VDERRYAISRFRSRTDVHPESYELTWGELLGALSTHQVYRFKEEAWLWSPARYLEGSTRSRHSVQAVSLFVADIDDGTTGDALCARLMLLGTSFLVASTWSHTSEHPHLRCVVPLEEPIPVQAYDQVWQQFNQHLFDELIDPMTKDPSRMFYAPSCPTERLGDVYVRQF
jgi:hypothetical protein